MSSEAEALAQLEDRIRKAVELVTSLRAERDSAIGEAAKLRAQIESMEQERGHVRSRIEKLLGQMDQL